MADSTPLKANGVAIFIFSSNSAALHAAPLIGMPLAVKPPQRLASRKVNTMENKAATLRRQFARERLIRVAGAHNGVSARLVERNGFDAVWASGFEISTSYAVPDASILTMTEFLEAARIMNDAVDLPVIADCDCGFGDASNVAYMIRRYEAAGIAAVCIEDKRFPKMNSFVNGGQELATIAEFVEKIHAAKDAQREPDLVVIARIEAFIAGCGQDEVLKRARAYADAGADAILVHSKEPTPAQIFGFMRAWHDRAPIVVIPTTYYETTAQEIERAGIRMVIYANHAMRATVRAMDEILAHIRDAGTTKGVEACIASLGELFELQGMTSVHRGSANGNGGRLAYREPRSRPANPLTAWPLVGSPDGLRAARR